MYTYFIQAMTENLSYIIIVFILIKQQLYFLYSETAAIYRQIRKASVHTIKASTCCTMTIADKLQEQEERYSCWCFLFIYGTSFEAKIMHKGRGKFKILNDEYGGKYSNKIDASDVIHCITEI
jgi:hypothetical protein